MLRQSKGSYPVGCSGLWLFPLRPWLRCAHKWRVASLWVGEVVWERDAEPVMEGVDVVEVCFTWVVTGVSRHLMRQIHLRAMVLIFTMT